MAGTKGRSARGVVIDLDMLRIKQQLLDAPISVEVKAREEMITTKRKRKKVTPPKTEEGES